MVALTARLYSERGVVAAVEVPPFDSGFPPAIVWRSRFYLRFRTAPSMLEASYRETFAFEARVEIVEAETKQ